MTIRKNKKTGLKDSWLRGEDMASYFIIFFHEIEPNELMIGRDQNIFSCSVKEFWLMLCDSA